MTSSSSVETEALAYAPIHVMAERLRAGDWSASQLLDCYLQRIRRHDGKLHAFVETYEKEARIAAELADRARQAGRHLGPLHGIPIAFKDLLDIEGRMTRGGSLFWRERVSPVTATVVQRLEAAGTITLGKTHMVEFAFGAWGTNETMGTPWNPWDPQTPRAPGGSSSGSGVAVAAGLAPAASGSDTGGSVRIPAALCGIVGLKTTVGRVSNHGALMLSATLDTLGPMTRDVEDAALLFDALHGPDPLDPKTIGHPRTDVLSGLRQGIRGMRFAVLPAEALGEVDPVVTRGFEDALAVLRDLGASISMIELPADYAALAEATGKVIAAEGYEKVQARVDANDPPMDEDVRLRLASGKKISAVEYIRILADRRRVIAEFGATMRDYDALLTPTTPLPAIPLNECNQRVAPLSRLTRAANLLDLCALAVPCGFTANGLPLSLQITGRGYDEARVLRIGWAYENATDWHTRHPTL